MKSTFKLTLAIALALGSSQAMALQLGQIRVKSALDEPLVAEIPIQLDSLTEAQGLNVSLASEADFTRAGLSRAGLEHLHFSIVNDTTGHKIVLVTSDQSVGDPYLDFLVQVNTSRGKQLREYTVLLDPVIAAPAPEIAAAPAIAAVTQTPAPVAMPAPQAQPAPAAAPPSSTFSTQVQQASTVLAPRPAPEPPAPAAQASAAPPASTHSGEYRVSQGDTLYHIAGQNRPDSQVSVDQMMLALQKSNPDAFYRDNINALKSGAILRIPTRDAVDATSVAEARARVHRQYEDWRGAAARKATTVVQSNTAPVAPAAPRSAKPAPVSDRLALVPPSQSGGAAASRPGEKGGTGSAEITGLKQQLTTAKESLTSLKQENGDLQSRVKDLEDISNKNQKLLGMKDAQVAELQRKLAEAQQAAAKPAAPANHVAAAASASSAATPQVSASTAGPAAATKSIPAQTDVAHANPAAGATPSRTTQPATKAVVSPKADAARTDLIGAMPWYRQPLAWAIGGVVILVLILLGLLRRRPRPLTEPESDSPSLADHFGASPYSVAADEGAHESSLPEHVDDRSENADEPIHESVVPTAQSSVEDAYGFTFDELPAGELVAKAGMPASRPSAADDEITREHGQPAFANHSQEPVYQDAPTASAVIEQDDDTREHAVPAFSDDPVDTKLDLARAYLDMGDPAGARAMLEEVLGEGSQTQKDEAQKLLEGMA